MMTIVSVKLLCSSNSAELETVNLRDSHRDELCPNSVIVKNGRGERGPILLNLVSEAPLCNLEADSSHSRNEVMYL